jgi:hypothetical protein
MYEHTIRFRIRPDGRVEELVEGVRGLGCEQLTERIEAKLGAVQQRQSTAEAFQPQDQAQSLANPLPNALTHPLPPS